MNQRISYIKEENNDVYTNIVRKQIFLNYNTVEYLYSKKLIPQIRPVYFEKPEYCDDVIDAYFLNKNISLFSYNYLFSVLIGVENIPRVLLFLTANIIKFRRIDMMSDFPIFLDYVFTLYNNIKGIKYMFRGLVTDIIIYDNLLAFKHINNMIELDMISCLNIAVSSNSVCITVYLLSMIEQSEIINFIKHKNIYELKFLILDCGWTPCEVNIKDYNIGYQFITHDNQSVFIELIPPNIKVLKIDLYQFIFILTEINNIHTLNVYPSSNYIHTKSDHYEISYDFLREKLN
jgi:hypothetical protein